MLANKKFDEALASSKYMNNCIGAENIIDLFAASKSLATFPSNSFILVFQQNKEVADGRIFYSKHLPVRLHIWVALCL